MREPQYMYMWEYLVREEAVAEFERIYGPDGDWVMLFKQADGYLRTVLHKDRSNPNRYITLDYWDSKASHDAFRARFETEFADLDRRCEKLTTHEKELGTFAVIDETPER